MASISELPAVTGQVQSEAPAQNDQQPKRTRRRIPVSCTLCHSRKLKCNRQKPCSSCDMRGEASKCVYVSKHPDDPHAFKRRRTGAREDELVQRLDTLERLIVNAAQGQPGENQQLNSDHAGQNGHTSTNGPSLDPGFHNPNTELHTTSTLEYFDKNGPHAIYAGATAFHGILHEVSIPSHWGRTANLIFP